MRLVGEQKNIELSTCNRISEDGLSVSTGPYLHLLIQHHELLQRDSDLVEACCSFAAFLNTRVETEDKSLPAPFSTYVVAIHQIFKAQCDTFRTDIMMSDVDFNLDYINLDCVTCNDIQSVIAVIAECQGL